jgi:hypothetical protein
MKLDQLSIAIGVLSWSVGIALGIAIGPTIGEVVQPVGAVLGMTGFFGATVMAWALAFDIVGRDPDCHCCMAVARVLGGGLAGVLAWAAISVGIQHFTGTSTISTLGLGIGVGSSNLGIAALVLTWVGGYLIGSASIKD